MMGHLFSEQLLFAFLSQKAYFVFDWYHTHYELGWAVPGLLGQCVLVHSVLH